MGTSGRWMLARSAEKCTATGILRARRDLLPCAVADPHLAAAVLMSAAGVVVLWSTPALACCLLLLLLVLALASSAAAAVLVMFLTADAAAAESVRLELLLSETPTAEGEVAGAGAQ